MSKGLKNNEELVKLYKESRNEEYLAELITQNTGLINILVSSYLSSIPNSELEDLVSESYIPMLKAIEDFDEKQGFSFSTLLKAYVRQHLNRLYNEASLINLPMSVDAEVNEYWYGENLAEAYGV